MRGKSQLWGALSSLSTFGGTSPAASPAQPDSSTARCPLRAIASSAMRVSRSGSLPVMLPKPM